ncbi:MAG: hypothetical protein A4E27_00942 [Methanobacterium sp. PtaU1.Bin242]|nr:MAG: hypothetical protein A4E27_00942 [Methanobacterium sp. PtaU1.Bin242]
MGVANNKKRISILNIQVMTLSFTPYDFCIDSNMGLMVDPSIAINIAPAKITAKILFLKLLNIHKPLLI